MTENVNIDIWMAKITKLFTDKKYTECFDLSNRLLKENLSFSDRKKIERLRDDNIDFIINDYTVYPQKIVESLKSHSDSKNIVFTITTCKRFDLFEKTINSFINCCEDIHKIDKWICVDDNSSEADRKKMGDLYPFFQFIWKTPEQKGHVESMNLIFAEISDYKYWCHMEDDWSFFEKRNYLTQCISILEENNDYGQILFNVSFAQRRTCRNIAGGFVKYHGGIRCVLHEYYPPGKEYDNFIFKYSGRPTQGYWPHYSLRPSVLKVSAILKIGDFKNETGHFEMDYAKRYVAAGYKSCFLDTICSYHIGKLTWEKGDNSYSLNGVKQFNNAPKKDDNKKSTYIQEDWLVVENHDSFGNDIKYIANADIETLKKEALLNENCVCFNSLGYIKNKLNPIDEWIDVSNRFPNFKMFIKRK